MASDSADPKPTLLSVTKGLVSRNAFRFARPIASLPSTNDEGPAHVDLTAEEVLREMDGADEAQLARLALEPACPESVLTAFVNNPSAALRAAAARNPRLNLGLLSMLAQNSQEVEAVLMAVAEHPSTSPESLQRLAGGAYLSVRMAAALHPSTPVAALLRLAGAPDVPVQLALAGRADLPEEVQQALLKAGPSTEVVRALASEPSVAENILAALAISEEPDIRLRVAVHPRLPAGPRQRLSTDPDWSVRQAARVVQGERGAASDQVPVVDDQTYLEFLTAEQQQERQDLMQALETLNSEALELARQRLLASLDRPRTVDEQRLRAAHQGRVLELERESRLTLERDLRILRQNLQAEAEREKRGTSLSLSKVLEQERQALREELKSRRARQLQEERTAIEQRRMQDLVTLRAQQAMHHEQVLQDERATLTTELERFLASQRGQLQREADERLQEVRASLEQKLQTELAKQGTRLEDQSLQQLNGLRASVEQQAAERQRELEAAFERLLEDQRAQLQRQAEERWAQERERLQADADQQVAAQQEQFQVRESERLEAERARLQVELEVQGAELLGRWQQELQAGQAQRHAAWRSEADAELASLQATLTDARQHALDEQRQHLEQTLAQELYAQQQQHQRQMIDRRAALQAEAAAQLEHLLGEQRQAAEAQTQQTLANLRFAAASELAEQERQLVERRPVWQAEIERQLEAEVQQNHDAAVQALKASLAEHQRRQLEAQQGALTTAFEQLTQEHRAEQQRAVTERSEELQREADAELAIIMERQRQAAEALYAPRVASLMAENAEALEQAELSWQRTWQQRRTELLAEHERTLAAEQAALEEQMQQRREQEALAGAELQHSRLVALDAEAAASLEEGRQARGQARAGTTLTAPGAEPSRPQASEGLPSPAVIGTRVGGYLVPAEVLPNPPEPVLSALRLILEHLDVQEDALARFRPDGQSKRSFLRNVDRAVDGFMQDQEHVILRTDREDGAHYVYNDRLPG